jgi:hypothetical protein
MEQLPKQPCLLQFALSKSFYSPAEGEYLEVVWVYHVFAPGETIVKEGVWRLVSIFYYLVKRR